MTERQKTLNMPPPPSMLCLVADADEVRVVSHPTFTYKLLPESNRIMGNVDGLLAMEQFIFKVIFTERYDYLIYNWNYGIELKGLFGQRQSFVKAELPRVITEALTNDYRIIAVRDFALSKTKQKEAVCVSFTVETIYGDVTVAPVFNYAQAIFVAKGSRF